MMSFDGDIMKWTQFWDLCEQNIDKNATLSDVNKFQYLRAPLCGQPAHLFHLFITEENYRPAVVALQQRYGQPTLLKGSLVASLKTLEPVYNAKDLNTLHELFDDIDTHFIALSVPGADSAKYTLW